MFERRLRKTPQYRLLKKASMHHQRKPLERNRKREAGSVCEQTVRAGRWLLSVSAFAVLTGCATAPSTDRTEWLDPQGRRTVDLSDVQGIDPVTAILASQHPLTRQALEQLGVNYRYGGTSPDRGFDCSGLIHYSAQASWGIKLPRRARDMARVGEQVKANELVVGDLVFFNTQGHRYSHVGIYLGGNHFVHAPSSGGQVRVESMAGSYWKQRYTGARRIEPIRLASQ